MTEVAMDTKGSVISVPGDVFAGMLLSGASVVMMSEKDAKNAADPANGDVYVQCGDAYDFIVAKVGVCSSIADTGFSIVGLQFTGGKVDRETISGRSRVVALRAQTI